MKSKKDPNEELLSRMMERIAPALGAFGAGLAGGTSRTTMMVALFIIDGSKTKPAAMPPMYPFPPPDSSFSMPETPKPPKRPKPAKAAQKPAA
jgi:hypothetical protein